MLKKYAVVIANSIVILFIIVLYAFVQGSELSFYKEMAYNQASNDVRLTAGDINAQLSSLASEQIIVSKMMSCDIFLRDWCHNEDDDLNGEHANRLYNYLMEYKLNYGYDCIFFVSDRTQNYYYDKGYFKTLDENDSYDSWYYGFMNSYKRYDIQVDSDPLNNDQISLFVNCLVQDKGFKTLGVVGVSRNIESFQKKFSQLEDEYNVTICAVNIGENYSSFDGSFGYYKKPKEAAELFSLTEEQVTQQIKAGEAKTWFAGNKCYNMIYNSELGWNIIVEKDISRVIEAILKKTYQRTFVMSIMVMLYTIVSFSLLGRLSQVSRRAENVDELTGLYNNKIFREIFEKKRKSRIRSKEVSLFMVDIDNFKSFNDNYGHLYGNSIIKLVAEALRACVGKDGIVARWGGDEFIGILAASPEETSLLLQKMLTELKKADTHKTVTCSCGVVKVDNCISLEKNMDKADEALYESKTKGKDCVSVYK